MALHVHVYHDRKSPNLFFVMGEWEDQRPFPDQFVRRQEDMTAAESVEFFFLEKHNLVASWSWSRDCCGHTGAIHGQFVSENPRGKAYKEVDNSRAHEFDL